MRTMNLLKDYGIGLMSDKQISELTEEYGVEFARVYVLGFGKKGCGGKYYLFSGDSNSVFVPVNKDVMLINHTHLGGTSFPSKKDKQLLLLYKQLGSPKKKFFHSSSREESNKIYI